MAFASRADSNGVSKAPWWRSTRSAEATAGATHVAASPAARAAASQAVPRTATEAAAMATAATPTAMTAGTSQPGA